MITVLGYGARPPGTYTAARRTGTSRSTTRWPGRERHGGVLAQARLGDRADVGDGELERRAQLWLQRGLGGRQLVVAHPQGRGLQAAGVELAREGHHRGVALGAHAGEDLGHRLLDRAGRRGERAHAARELRGVAVEREALKPHAGAPPGRRSPRP